MKKLPYDEKLFKRIAGNCKAEFYTYLPHDRTGMRRWEIKALYSDGIAKIVVLTDSGTRVSGEVIEVPAFASREERNGVIRTLYKQKGVSQTFLAKLFMVTQPTISIIVNKN